MKMALVVSLTEIKSYRPKLISHTRTIAFSDIDKGREFIRLNKQKVFHTQLVELEE